MTRNSAAVVGAAETTQLGKVPDLSVIGLHADAAFNAMRDCGLTPKDIDGVACGAITPVELAHYIGVVPTWVDGTNVGGCSFMLHLRHAVAAIAAGHCSTVLIAHGESGRSRIGTNLPARPPSSLLGQFEMPFGIMGAPTMFTIPALRYMKTFGVSEEDLAFVAVIQREWAARNPRASQKAPITIDDVLDSEMIAYPFRKLMCCLTTDGGGALIVTSAERARDFGTTPVYVRGSGESVESPLVSQLETYDSSRAFRVSGRKAFEEAGIGHADVDHLMIYDAFAHLPFYGLEDLGFCKPGEARDLIRARQTAIGGPLPVNTNGGGLSYMHSGMYGMYAMQESVRQLRGVAPAQIANAKVSVCHGVGGMFAAAGTIVFSNLEP
ncbi:MAG: thiolase [Caulobacteraceae bacterium]|nr:thiolase [Caulobacteraceae bacterium]